MTNILLVSETFMREQFEISDNLQSKFLLPAIREAQDIKFKAVVGECLYNRLIELVDNDDILKDDFIAYRDLINESRLFLGYTALVDLCVKTTVKLDNFGLNRTRDEQLDILGMDEMFQMKDYYQNKADSYCLYLQNWLLEHKDAFKELDCCHCNKIKSNLYSAASSNLYLGGARGKGYNGYTRRHNNYDKN